MRVFNSLGIRQQNTLILENVKTNEVNPTITLEFCTPKNMFLMKAK